MYHGAMVTCMQLPFFEFRIVVASILFVPSKNLIDYCTGVNSYNMASKYVLVEWDSDALVSVVPFSKLKSKEEKRVNQVWPSGTFSGTIIKQSGK